MSEAFDPYYTWLGIRPEEQPPHYYRLLALQPLEDNLDTIAHAADQRMTHLRTLQASRHVAECQRLLNEVAAAKICLLNAERKAAYDAMLQLRLAAMAIAPQPVAAHTPPPAKPMRWAVWSGGAVVAVACAALLAVLGKAMFGPAAGPVEVAQQPVERPAEEPAANNKPVVPQPSEPTEKLPPPDQPPSGQSPTAAPAIPNVPANPPVLPPKEPVLRPGDSQPAESPKPPPAETVADRPPSRRPAPTLAEQRKVAAEIEEVYRVSQAQAPAERLKLAADFLELAEKSSDRPAEQYVLWQQAGELACEAGEAAIALRAAALAAAEFDLDLPAQQQQIVERLAEKAGDAERLKSLVEESAGPIAAALEQQRCEAALAMAAAVHRAAQRSANKDLRKLAQDRRNEVQKHYDQWRQAEQARAALAARPDDAAAHLTLGRWLCLQCGDWTAGAPHLAQGDDAGLRAAAARELAADADTAELLRRGDAWWALASGRGDAEKAALLRRAGHWYGQAAGRLASPLEETKVQKRLEEIGTLLAELKPPLSPLAAKPAAPPAEAPRPDAPQRKYLSPAEAVRLFGLPRTGWTVGDATLSGQFGHYSEAASNPRSPRPRKTAAFAYGFKIKSPSQQTIHVVLDGQTYSYARGFAFGMATLVDAAGRQDMRYGEQIAAGNDWCALGATLRDGVLKFYYQGTEEWAIPIPGPRRAKHAVQVGFGSHLITAEFKDFYFEAE